MALIGMNFPCLFWNLCGPFPSLCSWAMIQGKATQTGPKLGYSMQSEFDGTWIISNPQGDESMGLLCFASHAEATSSSSSGGVLGWAGDKQKILTVSDCAISLRNKGVQKNQRLDRRETFMLSLNWYVDTGGTYLWLIRNHLHEAARQLRWLEKQLQLANTFEVRLQEGSRGISALSTFLNYFPIKRWDVLVSELLPHMTP